MRNRTLLIDSSYLLKRSVNGAKETYTEEFGHIGGLYSFLTTTRMLTKKYNINKIILFWDGQNGGIYRYKIDKDYKKSRKNKVWNERIELNEYEIKKELEKEESILKQRQRAKAYAEELFIRQIEVDDIEADDLIAYYCHNNHKTEDIILYSNDRDFAQLLSLDITIIFPNIDEPVTKKNFYFKFNYHYLNALTMKIICGDTSDDIKGIDLVKEKTLIKYFPELQVRYVAVNEIHKKSAKINKERIKNKKKPLKCLENIVNGIERLKINHRLINLKEPFLNEEAIEELEQLKIPLSPKGRNSKNLQKFMNEDGFFKVYKGNFVSYVEPFYTVIMNEKNILKEYKKSKIS